MGFGNEMNFIIVKFFYIKNICFFTMQGDSVENFQICQFIHHFEGLLKLLNGRDLAEMDCSGVLYVPSEDTDMEGANHKEDERMRIVGQVGQLQADVDVEMHDFDPMAD
jgi:hypothetical protein